MHTIDAVEICTAGMEWPSATGPVTITLEHIAAAQLAASLDPHVQAPRGRLGHDSGLNAGMPRHDPFAAIGDAEPAFGTFTNLRTTNDGAVLIGDAVGVPDWITAATFPSRSMEALFDITTPGGKRYSMVVTAVSWLGAYLPAVQDLEDLTTLMADGPAALTERQEHTVPNIIASVSTSVVRERFNFDWAMSDPVDGLNTYWWWARDIRVDPDEIIVDDDEGGLWSIPYTTDGEDAVQFGEPTRVRETYLPVSAAASGVQTSAPADQRVLASFSRPSKQDPTMAAASAGPDTEESTMDDTVRDFLVAQGIDPDVATEDQNNAANVYIAAGFTPPSVQTDDDTADTDEAAEAEPQTVTASAPTPPASGTVVVDEARLTALEAAEATRTGEDRARVITAAMQEGRFAPARRQHYETAFAADPVGTRHLLTAAAADGGLAPNTVPVKELGGDTAPGARADSLSRVLASIPSRKAS